MVTIVDYAARTRSDGTQFFALVLQGGIELVKNKQTDRFYATVKKASIPSTFDEATCKASIGQQFPGTVQKQSCEPYTYTVKETGDMLELNYRWAYLPEGATLEEAIFEGELVQPEAGSRTKPQRSLTLR